MPQSPWRGDRKSTQNSVPWPRPSDKVDGEDLTERVDVERVASPARRRTTHNSSDPRRRHIVVRALANLPTYANLLLAEASTTVFRRSSATVIRALVLLAAGATARREVRKP